jgi:DNA polymerase III subunit beta
MAAHAIAAARPKIRRNGVPPSESSTADHGQRGVSDMTINVQVPTSNVVAFPAGAVDSVIAESLASCGITAPAGDGNYSTTDEPIAAVADAAPETVEAVADVPEPIIPAKLTVSRDAFAAAVAACVRAVEKRNTIPVLTNLLIVGNEYGMRVTGTNLDIAISADVSATGDAHFAATVPAHMLSSVLAKAKIADSIILSYADDGKVSFRLGGSLSVDLHSITPNDFPTFQAGDLSHSFAIPTADLIRAFEKVELAISKEEARYYLNGVYVHHLPARRIDQVSNGSNGTLRFVATDGHRMAVVDLPAPAGAEGMPGYIMQASAVKQFLALAKGKGAPSMVAFNVHAPLVEKDEYDGTEQAVCGPRLSLTIGNLTLANKPIDGTFPDYCRVIPTGNDSIMRVEVADLDNAVNQVTCISSERGRAVRLSITESVLCLSVSNPDAGTARSEITCDFTVPKASASAMDIGFNSRYVRDILAHIDGEVATFKLADPGSPTLICGDGDADKGVMFVLMPMRV